MLRTVARVGVFVVSVLGPVGVRPVFCQPPAATPPPPKPKEETSLVARLKEQMKEPDQGGGLHFTKHWAVAFGGIKQGSAIALGPAFSSKFANGNYVQLKAVLSIKKFRLLQARYDTRRFWTDRAVVVNRVRWQDAPKLGLYRLGIDSPDAKADYAERKTEVSSQLNMRLQPRVRIGAGFGVERFSTHAGSFNRDELPDFPIVPGLAEHPWFGHAVFAAAFDSRTSPDYSRSGRLLGGGVHVYRDLRNDQGGFQMYEVGAQQLVPMFDQRGVLELTGRTWLTQSSRPEEVPFYLMPTLGGGDYLRAFPLYRFRDREAGLLKAEYRWAVHKAVDVAGLYEGGTVARDVSSLDFHDLAHSFAVGIRVHSKTASLLRLDAAHGREGWGFRLGFNTGGS